MGLLDPKESGGRPACALVLGGGLAGLSVALGLLRCGWHVTLLEKNTEPGGLARTIRLPGGAAFDLGGHRFLTDNKEILATVMSLLDGEMLEVQRKSRICLQGRFFDYPLNPRQAVFSFGPRMSSRILVDYMRAHLRLLLSPTPEESFEDWAVARFGSTLYRIFFKPYTEKVWGIPARELSGHWSKERIDLLHLFHALFRSVFRPRKGGPRTYADRFIYPRGGIGRLAERLAQQVQKEGGLILCGVEVEALERGGSHIETVVGRDKHGRRHVWSAARYISTIPIEQWIGRLRPPPPPSVRKAASELRYRHMIFVHLLLRGDRVTDDTWIYLPESQMEICRLHEPKNWSADLVPGGLTSLCAEIFSSREEGLWLQPDDVVVERVIAELRAIGILDPRRVMDATVVRVPYTHPILRVAYTGHLEVVHKFIDARLVNYHLLGRTGAFQYKNMDQVMADGFALAQYLATRGAVQQTLGDPGEVRNTDHASRGFV